MATSSGSFLGILLNHEDGGEEMNNIIQFGIILVTLTLNLNLLGQVIINNTMNPTLKIKGGLNDSIVTFHYSIPGVKSKE
jgi:hypothetical protein